MPTSLTATKIKDTYGQLLHVDGGVTSTLKTVYDGDGTATALKISSIAVEIPSFTLSGGTANGVVYLNGSKVATTGSALTFDGTNLGIGITSPSARLNIYGGASDAVMKLANATSGNTGSDGFDIAFTGSNVYFANRESGFMAYEIGGSEQMRLTSTGLGIGTSSPSEKLEVVGVAKIRTTVGSGIQIVSATTPYIQAFGASGNNVLQLNGQSISFWSGASYGAEGERMRLDSSGNLGLGITPSAWSQGKVVEVGSKGSAFWGYGATQNFLTANAYFDGAWKYGSNGVASYYTQDGSHRWFTAPSGTAGNAISFTQAMTLDASGNLGIGTSSPTAIGSSKVVEIGASSGNSAFQLFSVAGAIKASMYGNASEASIGSVPAIPLLFKTSDTERMRIDSSGNLLVGNTDTTSIGVSIFPSGIVRQNVSGTTFTQFRYSGTDVGSITTNGSTTTYATSSDYRLKENIQPMQNALARNALLKPCTYSWKADGSTGEGFIAHELQAVCPDAVTGEKDAVDKDGKPVYQGVDTSFLVGHLVACIQELKAELDATKAEVAALKGA